MTKRRIMVLATVLCLVFAFGCSAAMAQETAPEPQPALTGDAGPSGLTYRYHEGEFGTTLDLDALEPVRTGEIETFVFPADIGRDSFGVEWFGAVEVPVDGEYTFYTTSDDGSRLYIGETLVVRNDYDHGATEKSGAIRLAAGRHPIYVAYYEGAVDEVLEVAWEGPGIEKGPIPAEALTRHEKVVKVPTDGVRVTELTWPENELKLTVTMDTRDAPEMAAFHEIMPEVLREYYPKMIEILDAWDLPLRDSVRLTMRPGIDYPAYASGPGITFSSDWFAAHPEDLGCIIHEMTHIVQSFVGPNQPGWLVEGLADYVRHKTAIDTAGWKLPDGYKEGQHYTNGYGVVSAFLLYVEGKYDPDMAKKCHRAMKTQTYSSDLWVECTGKTVDELWEEYKTAK